MTRSYSAALLFCIALSGCAALHKSPAHRASDPSSELASELSSEPYSEPSAAPLLVGGSIKAEDIGPSTTNPASSPQPEITAVSAAKAAEDRLETLVEGLLKATHAHHIKLALAAGPPAAAEPCFVTTATGDELQFAINAGQSIISGDRKAIKDWVAGRPSSFLPTDVLGPLLQRGPTLGPSCPVSAALVELSQRASAPRSHVKAITHLLQILLEVDRDGDALQDTMAFYNDLGLPVTLSQIGISPDRTTIRPLAQKLASQSLIAAPYAITPRAWRLALTKLEAFGLKVSAHKNPALEMADSILKRSAPNESRADAALASLAGRIPYQRLVIVGHSYTRPEHWSAPTSFAEILSATLKKLSPTAQVVRFSQGGLTTGEIANQYLLNILDEEPQAVIIAAAALTGDDIAGLEHTIKALNSAKIKVFVLDATSVWSPYDHHRHHAEAAIKKAQEFGAQVIAVQASIDERTAEVSGYDLSLDRVHMAGPYHMHLAELTLRGLAGWPTTPPVRTPEAPVGRLAIAFDDVLASMGEGSYFTVNVNDAHWAAIYDEALTQGRSDLTDRITELFSRVVYFEALQAQTHSIRLNHGPLAPHVLMLHKSNLVTAALPVIEQKFKSKAWQILDLDKAYGDPSAPALKQLAPQFQNSEFSNRHRIDELLEVNNLID